MHRSDLGRGFALAFRRPQATVESVRLGLRGLEAQGLYSVRHHDAGWTREMRGAELAALTVTLPTLGSCALISYRRLPCGKGIPCRQATDSARAIPKEF